MKIVIDLSPVLRKLVRDQSAAYILATLVEAATDHPEHKWIFLSNDPAIRTFPAEVSATFIRKKMLLPGISGWKIWFSVQIPRLLKTMNADLFVSTGAIAIASPVKQILWMPDPLSIGWIKPGKYQTWISQQYDSSLPAAKSILVCCDADRDAWVRKDVNSKDKIVVIYAAPEEADYLSWAEKGNRRVQFAGGKEYFAVRGNADSIITVLKAFSQFKKRQQSNMQLVLITELIDSQSEFHEKLESYKYRADVHVHDEIPFEKKYQIMRAAYAVIICQEPGDPGLLTWEAFAAEVPVISFGNLPPAEIIGSSSLFDGKDNEVALAESMMLVYKDETMRNDCIESAKKQVAEFDRGKSAVQFWKALLHEANIS